MHALPELLDLLDLGGELLSESLLQGLENQVALVQESRSNRYPGLTNLGLAGRVATQAIEGSRLNSRLCGDGGGTKGRSAQSQGGSHGKCEQLDGS